MADTIWPSALFVTFIIAQRLAELALARRNTRRLVSQGAYEVGADHYPLVVLMHAGWIACLTVFGMGNALSSPWLVGFVLLQLLRICILATMGSRWTTRIIVVNEPLVARGPFRFLRHPNYALVVAEIIVAPMVLGLPWVAAIFTLLNAIILSIRIRAEDRALAPLRT